MSPAAPAGHGCGDAAASAALLRRSPLGLFAWHVQLRSRRCRDACRQLSVLVWNAEFRTPVWLPSRLSQNAGRTCRT
eukprot:9121205-Alexandrium_andersonii.AAC.1